MASMVKPGMCLQSIGTITRNRKECGKRVKSFAHPSFRLALASLRLSIGVILLGCTLRVK